ncbi:alpha/beta fold hydrolase [Paralcaligenes ureilyticus]|uniref:Pimeloyl-ACP methyl ester carboxylesterase n=1 Tax=Paralcaligenes ureilyticus TaxID=627131 RepID=A0A4R3MBL7_9BURK|nr:alpha/beta hydrolase [Paralcaligenes ureilyticus]TCT09649.1 pimeloyl-ACP methyl ester carboxylesterase [Paralcaligenes ureilyticus]
MMEEIRSGFFTSNGGVKLYYQDVGSGVPIVFVHEFAGDYRSWEPQVRYFSHRFRVITFNARGYPPSDVPTDSASYSLDLAVDDIAQLLHHLEISDAHIVGFSMGSFSSLFFGMRHPELARSVTPVCCGYGAEKGWDEIHKRNFFEFADLLEDPATASTASDQYATGSTRVQFRLKDPRGWSEFAAQFRMLSCVGRAMTLRYVVAARPSVLDFAESFRKMTVPVLLITGDEDEQTLMPGVFMKKHIPTAGFCVLPRIGHTLNLEEPALFNAMLYDFISSIELGTWQPRDPRTFATTQYLEQSDH